MAQPVEPVIQEPEVPGSIPTTYSPFANSRRAVTVIRNRVVRFTDCFNMTI